MYTEDHRLLWLQSMQVTAFPNLNIWIEDYHVSEEVSSILPLGFELFFT